ncbi:MAG: rane protein required for colicin production [Pseudomonadota bacterium]|nr:rane protein required for colicin production [Pseudomonadota bacterium]
MTTNTISNIAIDNIELLTSNYDLIFLGIIIFSSVIALIRGALSEILSLSVWIISFVVLHRFSSLFDRFIPSSVTNQFLRSVIIFLAAFIIISIAIAIVKKLCTAILSSIGLGGLNHLLGIVFGIARGILICAILILVIEILKLDPQNSWKNAKLYPVVHPVLTWITQAIPSPKELSQQSLYLKI